MRNNLKNLPTRNKLQWQRRTVPRSWGSLTFNRITAKHHKSTALKITINLNQHLCDPGSEKLCKLWAWKSWNLWQVCTKTAYIQDHMHNLDYGTQNLGPWAIESYMVRWVIIHYFFFYIRKNPKDIFNQQLLLVWLAILGESFGPITAQLYYSHVTLGYFMVQKLFPHDVAIPRW